MILNKLFPRHEPQRQYSSLSPSLMEMLMRSNAGGVVSPETALSVSAVLACVRVLAETLASVPLILYRRLPDGGKVRATDHPLYSILHDSPNEWQTSFEWREMMMGHITLRGNCYSRIIPGPNGGVTQLLPLHAGKMKVQRLSSGRLTYELTTETGQRINYIQDEILHIRGLSSDGVTGLSPVELARNPIGLSMATEQHGSALFRNGAQPGVVLEHPEALTFDVADTIARRWDEKHAGSDKAFKTSVLMEGMKAHEIGMSNEDSQFLETRRFQIEEIARIFRVPIHLIGDLSRATNNNIEHQSLEFIIYSMMPWFRRWESAINSALTVPTDNVFCEFLVDGLLRGDSASRATFYTQLFNIGVLTVNEMRSMENLNGIGEDGDKRFVPLNMTTLEKAGEEPAVAPPQPPPDNMDDDLGERLGRLEVLIAESTAQMLAAAQAEAYEQAAVLKAQIALMESEGLRLASELSVADKQKLEAVAIGRSMLRDAFGRMLQRELYELTRAAKKPDTFGKAVEDFYAEHALRLSQALSEPVKMLALHGVATLSADEIAQRHVAESMGQILALKCSNATMAAKVAECVESWSQREPNLKGSDNAETTETT